MRRCTAGLAAVMVLAACGSDRVELLEARIAALDDAGRMLQAEDQDLRRKIDALDTQVARLEASPVGPRLRPSDRADEVPPRWEGRIERVSDWEVTVDRALWVAQLADPVELTRSLRIIPRLIPCSLTSATARSIAPVCPDNTTCEGSLSLAISQISPCAAASASAPA